MESTLLAGWWLSSSYQAEDRAHRAEGLGEAWDIATGNGLVSTSRKGQDAGSKPAWTSAQEARGGGVSP